MEEELEMLDRFKRDIAKDADILSEQRDKADEDMRFIYVDGGQWENFLEKDFQGRARLQFDYASQVKNKFVGEYSLSRLGVEYDPDDDATTDDDAELLSGIYRADFRDNSGREAVETAIDECATCGFGAYGMFTEYRDEEDPENELQKIVWRPIHNAYNSVFYDRSARRADKQDARWVTELTPYTIDAFESEFPDIDPSSAYTPQDRSYLNENGSANEVYVATRYEMVKKKEPVFIYNNLATGQVETYSKDDHELIKDELSKSEIHRFVRERKIPQKKVMMSRFVGNKFIEEPRQIAGTKLPIIPMYAYRAFINGVEYYFGLIRPIKDACRAFNVQMNQLVENAASAGQEVPIFGREQIEAQDVAQLWADKNNKPFLYVDPLTDGDGNIVSAGPIGYNKPPMLDQSTSALLEIIPNFLREVTGGAPQDTLDPDASGKAINAMIKQRNLTTQSIRHNIEKSFVAAGDLYQSIASDIYSTKQMVRTLGKDGSEGKEILFKQVADPKTGRLIEANTLRGKRFRAHADVGPEYGSMKEQTVEDLKGIADTLKGTAAGEKYLDVIISTMLDNASGVGMGPLKEFNRKQMMLQQLVEPQTDEEKEWLAQATQPQEDPNQKLMEAAAAQQIAEAKNLDASAIDKVASAEKKAAETQKIFAEIDMDKVKTAMDQQKSLVEIRQSILGQARGLN